MIVYVYFFHLPLSIFVIFLFLVRFIKRYKIYSVKKNGGLRGPVRNILYINKSLFQPMTRLFLDRGHRVQLNGSIDYNGSRLSISWRALFSDFQPCSALICTTHAISEYLYAQILPYTTQHTSGVGILQKKINV